MNHLSCSKSLLNKLQVCHFLSGGSVLKLEAFNKTIVLLVPSGTDVMHLVPTIMIKGKSVRPTSDVAGDFSNPVIYTVSGQGGKTVEYAVTALVATIGSKEIKSFIFKRSDNNFLTKDYVVKIINAKITFDVLPFGTNVKTLVPTIELNEGVAIQPKSGVA